MNEVIDIKTTVNTFYKKMLDAQKSPYGSFKVQNSDFKLFKDIVRYIELTREEKVSRNTLFAKLFIYNYQQMIHTYNTDCLEDIPQKEISKILNTPLDFFFQAFYNKLHSNWNDSMCEKILKGKDISKEYVSEKYTLEKVTEVLTEMINEALLRFE